MTKILVIGDHLLMAGAEKLIYEIIKFAKNNQVQPTILIINNYNIEYYDSVYEKMGIKVIRTRLDGLIRLRNPFNLITSIYWKILLKYRAEKNFKHVHVIGLYNAEKVVDTIFHTSRFFWHVNNLLQFSGRKYSFPGNIFENEKDTVVCINKYQIEEIENQYGLDSIKCQINLFKLFINDL